MKRKQSLRLKYQYSINVQYIAEVSKVYGCKNHNLIFSSKNKPEDPFHMMNWQKSVKITEIDETDKILQNLKNLTNSIKFPKSAKLQILLKLTEFARFI